MISGKAYTRNVSNRRITKPCHGFRNLVSEWPVCIPVIPNRFNSDADEPVRLHHPFEMPQTTWSSST